MHTGIVFKGKVWSSSDSEA